MKEKLFKAISEYNMFSVGDSVTVGVSGGADSMCLLDILDKYKEELGISLSAAHVNHCLRGNESDRDEAFVREYCERKNIPFHLLKVDINRLSEEKKIGTELCARNVRYEFFSSLKTDKIATAHTASDAIETMLMNISRGSGLKGLCSIPPRRLNIVRPLCYFNREDTEKYCRENHIDFVTDSSNLSDDYTRNKFRHGVIGALKSINPSFEQNALRCIDSIRNDNDFISACAEELYINGLCEARRFSLSAISQAHSALRYRVIAEYITANSSSDFEKKHIMLIDSNRFADNFALELPSKNRLCIRNGFMFFEDNAKTGKRFPETNFDKNTYFEFSVDSKTYGFSVSRPRKLESNEIAVDFSEIDDIITIRSRKEGDRLSLSTRHCTKTLKKLFSELKIPVGERESVPVLADSKGVIWCQVGGVDQSRKISRHTEKYLIIKSECGKNE